MLQLRDLEPYFRGLVQGSEKLIGPMAREGQFIEVFPEMNVDSLHV